MFNKNVRIDLGSTSSKTKWQYVTYLPWKQVKLVSGSGLCFIDIFLADYEIWTRLICLFKPPTGENFTLFFIFVYHELN